MDSCIADDPDICVLKRGRGKDFFVKGRMQFDASDEAFARLMSHNMTVPQRIKATGEFDDDNHGPNGMVGRWDYSQEKFDMKVPDRILLVGQDQIIGTKAPPREIQLDNAVLPTDPGMVRVQTPPRVITLDQHYFPSADDFPAGGIPESPPRQLIRPVRLQGDGARATPRPDTFNDSTMTESRIGLRDITPPGSGEGLSTVEEIVHLRRQMVKINRRVMAIEAEHLQRQQKEKIVYAFGIAYFIFKVIAWLNRS